MSAWADGAPTGGAPLGGNPPGGAPTATGVPYGAGAGSDGISAPPGGPGPGGPLGGQPNRPRKVTDVVTERVSRVQQFEGLRGRATRSALALKYVVYFCAVLLASGLTQLATNGVRFASGGGVFLLVASAVIVVTGAISSLFYVNLRNEIVERVRHYIFGITLIPGMMVALLLRAVQQWEWANEGSLGTTLQMALPAVFLATVALPGMIFIKEMLGIRTIHRSKLDDQEAVALWTRQDAIHR